MKRFAAGVIVGLLLVGAVVLAQGSAWSGQQWEYLILNTVSKEERVVILPLVGDVGENSIGAYATDIHERAAILVADFYETEPETRFDYPFYLKLLGEDGWELAGVYPAGLGDVGQVFKRPKQ